MASPEPSSCRGVLAAALLAALTARAATAAPAPITALVFAPDGKTCVCAEGRSIQVRDANDANEVRRWATDLAKVTALRFAPSGKFLAVAGGTPGEHGEVRLFGWPDGRDAGRRRIPSDLANALDFDPSGSRVVVGGGDGIARIWDLEAFETAPALAGAPPLRELRLVGHSGPIYAVAWEPTGRSIATAGADRSIKLWDAATGGLLRTLSQHNEAIRAMAFRPHSAVGADAETPTTLATAGDDRTVRLWQPALGRMVRIVRGHPGQILSLAWMPDGTSLISGGTDGVLRAIDGGSDSILGEVHDHDDWIYAVAVGPDGSRIASADASGAVRIRSSFALRGTAP
ncbi:MAG: WD40 repeat domain-containing protein [Verrucomicrobiales bacterium]|nr:WD40 repeat domain-containing protein [Verrucomicrobiales bacterium]